MRKICLWGTSLKKPGDEAQVLSIILLLKQYYPDIKIVLFSKYSSLLNRISDFKDGSVKAVRTRNVFKVFNELRKSNYLLFIGAPFYEEKIQALSTFMLYIATAISSVKRACFAITIFPFSTGWGKAWYRFLLNRMQFILVRDHAAESIINSTISHDRLDKIPDLRYVLNLPDENVVRYLLEQEGIDKNKPIIGFTTRYLSPNVPDWVKKSQGYSKENVDNINSVLANIASFYEEKAQVVVFPMHPDYNDDQRMAEVIQSKMKNAGNLKLLKSGYRAREIIALIGSCDLLVASRAGSTIFASAANVPILGIAYDERMKSFMKDFNISEFVFDWRNVQWREVEEALTLLETENISVKNRIKSKAETLSTEINKKFEHYLVKS